jgi:hypothetical protein
VFDTELDYDDPLAPVIDAEAIVRRAVRVRRRRRAAAGLASLVVVALIGVGVAVYPRGVLFDPAAGGPALDQRSPDVAVQALRSWPGRHGTKTYLYYSRGGQVCAGAIAYDPPGAGPQTIYSCGLGLAETTPPWVQKPFALYTRVGGLNICIGLVSGRATTVSIDLDGTHATGRVYPVEMPGFSGLGAYVMLLPAGRVDPDYLLRDMTNLVATDAQGHVVATG